MSSPVEVLADRARVGFRIPYRAALIESMRSLFKQNKGYWAPDLRAWVVPAETAYGVVRELGRLAPDLFSAGELCRQIDSARREPDRAIAQRIGITLHPV